MTARQFLYVLEWAWTLVGFVGVLITGAILWDALNDWWWVKSRFSGEGQIILARNGLTQAFAGLIITFLMSFVGLWALTSPATPSRPGGPSTRTMVTVIGLILIEILVVVSAYGSLRVRRVLLRSKKEDDNNER